MNKDIEVNYKNKKRYKTSKYPIRQPIYLTWLIYVLSKIMTFGMKIKVDKVNMEGLKPPYMILSNHMSFLDFEILATAMYPQRMNNVVNIDGYYQRAWLMEWIGSIPTRKFAQDTFLIKSIFKVLSRGDVLCMYPEARYSPCGIDSYLPDTLGALVKKCKVPLVTVVHRGNHLHSPFWNFRKKRKVKFHTTITQTLTTEEIEKMSVEEINAKIKESLTYNEYNYQKENNILITEKYRAEGLHRILYQCPHCKSEHDMDSTGTEIFCKKCGKRWTLLENGALSALDGNDIFTSVPDWFRWERMEVENQINNGEFNYLDEVDVYSFPRCYSFVKLGKGKISLDPNNGFILEGNHNNAKYYINRKPLQINSLHVEYEYFRIKRADCFVINTENDSFFCYPKQENIITKLAFATEIIHQNALKNKR